MHLQGIANSFSCVNDTLHTYICNYKVASCYIQIADFGMSRDLIDTNYYIASGGKVPVKWTAPEVHYIA